MEEAGNTHGYDWELGMLFVREGGFLLALLFLIVIIRKRNKTVSLMRKETNEKYDVSLRHQELALQELIKTNAILAEISIKLDQ